MPRIRYRPASTEPTGKRPLSDDVLEDDRDAGVAGGAGSLIVGSASGVTGAPQLLQERLSGGISDRQDGHCIAHHTLKQWMLVKVRLCTSVA